MSHFTVLVIGENIEEQLQPFHEFECTGENDEYIEEEDVTEEYKSSYETGSTEKVVTKDGKYLSPYEDEFYRVPTKAEKEKLGKCFGSGVANGIDFHSKDWGDGLGYSTRVRELPKDVVIKDVPYTEIYKDFAEYLKDYDNIDSVEYGEEIDIEGEHKFSYAQLDENGNVSKVVRRTNPNARWDWWVVGGRWSGYFKAKDGCSGAIGRSGVFDNKPKEGWYDSMLKGDIDFEGMEREACNEAKEKYEKVFNIFNGKIPKVKTWEQYLADGSYANDDRNDSRREDYHNQEGVKAFKRFGKDDSLSDEDKSIFIWWSVDDFQMSKEAFCRGRVLANLPTFAVLKDGEWFERGEMGWWGIVKDEKDAEKWNYQWRAMVKQLPDDTRLTVVDCHI